ncbi:hypothetical protein BPTFM16_02136 [Altererythrobacter insulae]|nr:hypothetical protein BPTFM16_02136 [Altererythrobacter insulae]
MTALSFRASALAAKFGFIVVLAVFLQPAEVGQYGLIAVTINFSLYFLGLDFYVYANREYRTSTDDTKGSVIWQMAYLFCVTYAVLGPCLIALSLSGILPWDLLHLIAALAILEHLSTELYRFLVITGRPVLASFGFFIRLGLWPACAAVVMWLEPSARNLHDILVFWTVGALLSIGIPMFILITKKVSFARKGIDWAWIMSGLKITLPFLAGTLCLRGVQTFDRYIFNELVGADVLGAFVFFASLASLLPAMLQAGVYSFAIPSLVTLAHERNWPKFFAKMQALKKEIFISTTLLSLGIVFGSRIVTEFIGNPIYSENYALLYLAVFANCVFAASMYFHMALYALKKDQALTLAHICALISFFVVTYIASFFSVYLAVPLGVAGANVVMLGMKLLSYRAALEDAIRRKPQDGTVS